MTDDSHSKSAEVRRLVVPALQTNPQGGAILERPQDAIRGVKVEVSVLLGNADVSVGTLFEMKSGEVLPLDRRIDEPLDLVVDGKVVARGELVVVENSLGLRITEIGAR